MQQKDTITRWCLLLYRMMLSPVIASGFGKPKILSMVGAISASLPSCSLQSAYCLLMTKMAPDWWCVR